MARRGDIFNTMKQRTTLLALIAFTLFFVGYLPVFQILVTKWLTSDEYSHAFLTLPFIFHMVWVKRSKLHDNPVRCSFLGLILLGLSMLIYMFALLTQVHTVISLSMLMTVVGVIIYLGGVNTVKDMLTPLILLVMLIPLPDQLYIQITFPLQLKVSQITEIIIKLVGVPIFREGNIMHIPEKSFEVVEACSGLRSIITLFTLSVIIGYYTLSKGVSKLILVVSSIPIAIFVNIFRVIFMILLLYFFGIDITAGIFHTIMGMVIFGIALLLFLIIQFILQRVLEQW